MTEQKIIVTSALPYVNNIPHLGTLVCIIGADVYARYLRLRKRDVISVLGTDEHGTTAETKALEEGITPQQLVDKYFAKHTEIYAWFGCSFDCYGRTSSQANHKTSIEIFEGLQKNGYILEQEMEQLFCEKDQRFLADRFVEGKCPYCGFIDARGDQCDSCGKLINPSELLLPRCKVCGTKPILKKTKHLFIDLPKLSPELNSWIKSVRSGWSQNARSMTDGWLSEGLKPRAITRDLKWGIPVPGYPGKVFYSWFDAPIGYISITREKRPDWEAYWKSDSQLVQFMGKDNIPFHTILFPAFLIGSRQDYTLVKKLSVNEYLNYEGGKFSKSRNIGVFGDDAMASGIASDAYRYYLMINRPERADTEFIWKDFQDKINNELVANIGNLVNRTLTFIERFYEGVIPEGTIDEEFKKQVSEQIKLVEQKMENIQLKDALREIMALSKMGNQYFQECQPWKAIKEEPGKAKDSIHTLAWLVKALGILIEPFMPSTSKGIMDQMNVSKSMWDEANADLEAGPIGKPAPLFRILEDEDIAKLQEKFGTKEASFPLDLRVSLIQEVSDHPNADKLYVIKVDDGMGGRQILAGLRGLIPKEELIGKKVIVVCNLEHAKLRGLDSQGMMLASDDDGKVRPLYMSKSEIGMAVKAVGMPVSAKSIKIEHFRTFDLKAMGGKAVFEGKILQSDAEEALVDAKDNAKIR